MKPLRVCLEARLVGGTAGGVEDVLSGLASGLSSLGDGDEEYLFLAVPAFDDWLLPHVGGRCHVLHVRAWPGMRDERTEALVKSMNVDLMHFPFQQAFRTTIPSIYQPWDLQHRHLPELFSAEELEKREKDYAAFCKQAKLVVVSNQWTRNDVVDQLGLNPDKVAVVPTVPALHTGMKPTPAQLEAVRVALALPESFLFYPAQTWAHKNHLNLLKALATLRSRGIEVPLVCSGRKNAYFEVIEGAIRDLGLQDLVKFTGFVTAEQISGLYALASAVIVPSKFEGACLPVMEAFAVGRPVACSTATCLPEVAGQAALMLDPDDVDAMAAAIEKLWTDQALRADLVKRGRHQTPTLTWSDIARRFRAQYRRVAGRELTGDDKQLLASG